MLNYCSLIYISVFFSQSVQIDNKPALLQIVVESGANHLNNSSDYCFCLDVFLMQSVLWEIDFILFHEDYFLYRYWWVGFRNVTPSIKEICFAYNE